MKVKNIILIKLDSYGAYGSNGLSIVALLTGFKDIDINDVENEILSLFHDNLIIILNSSKGPEIALNPKKKDEIEKIIRAS